MYFYMHVKSPIKRITFVFVKHCHPIFGLSCSCSIKVVFPVLIILFYNRWYCSSENELYQNIVEAIIDECLVTFTCLNFCYEIIVSLVFINIEYIIFAFIDKIYRLRLCCALWRSLNDTKLFTVFLTSSSSHLFNSGICYILK